MRPKTPKQLGDLLIFIGFLFTTPMQGQTQRLNDTAQIICYNATASTGTVSSSTPDPETTGFDEQDCTRGAAAADALGRMVKIGGSTAPGRDYSKIANDGSVLPASAMLGSGPRDWACTQDNITGLIWEVKVNNVANLRHSGHSYNWYDINASVNGGNAGTLGAASSCNNTLTNCNTTAYRNAINALSGPARLCGATDWRLPTGNELRSLFHAGLTTSAGAKIDTTWFPNTSNNFHWSGESFASGANLARAVNFSDGNLNGRVKANSHVVRLVRVAPSITVAPTIGLVTTEAGGTASFAVVLNSQPTASVSIALSSSDTTEGTVAPTSLTFTMANWATARTVTVTGVDDAIVDGNVPYSIVTAAAVSSDSNYDGLDPANVSLTNIDNDSAGLEINLTSGLITSGAGGPASLPAGLNTQLSTEVFASLTAQTCPAGNPRVAPDSRYTISSPDPVNHFGQFVVVDSATGLMWNRCSEGKNGATCAGVSSSHSWTQALLLANGSAHAGFNDWRLPNSEELQSLVETGCFEPSINSATFPATESSLYWSSTTYAIDSTVAWNVSFSIGTSELRGKSNFLYVRLVRSGRGLDSFGPELNLFANGFEAP